jgi:hypothetical protein
MTTRFLAIAAAALMLSTSLASAHGPGAPVGHVGGFHGVAPGRSFAGRGFGGFHASGGNFGAPRYGGYGLGDYYGAGGGYGGPVYADGPSYSGGNGIGAGIAGVILGLATGGAIGSAIYAQPPVVYAPAPVYGQPLGATYGQAPRDELRAIPGRSGTAASASRAASAIRPTVGGG